MLQSIKQLYGHKLSASDGEIGHVKDFYFDDHNWAVRYAIADTGTWLAERKVLLSPRSFGNVHEVGKFLLVNLTRKQIEDSPSIDLHKPVSRQYEELFHHYYGWPYYWEGSGLWGMSDYPMLDLPSALPNRPAAANEPQSQPTDPHLRSTQAVEGYSIQASDGPVGHVCDFMMNPKNWAITQMVVKTGNRFTGKEVQVPTCKVKRISYEKSTIFVNLTMEDIKDNPSDTVATADAKTVFPV
jgi:hypothetical protein